MRATRLNKEVTSLEGNSSNSSGDGSLPTAASTVLAQWGQGEANTVL